MKPYQKILLGIIISLTLFACEDTNDPVIPEDTEQASIQITNLSSNPAEVWIYDLGSTSTVHREIPADNSETISIYDGDAGLDVNGGRAIIDYRHIINSEEVDELSSTHADLSPVIIAEVDIDNEFGCLDIESYSQTAVMWVNINNGYPEFIEPWDDLTKFYLPAGNSITKSIQYNGYTLFQGETEAEIFKDSYTRLNIYPDAGCIWVNNISSSYYITEVYFTPTNNPNWGYNQLLSDISPGEFTAWTCTNDIYWDIKIVDNENYEFTSRNFYLGNDELAEFDYDGYTPIRQPSSGTEKPESDRHNLSQNQPIRIELTYSPVSCNQ